MEIKNNYYRTKIKTDLCVKHMYYIKLIYRMSRGTGMVLQEQFVKIILQLGIDNTKRTVLKKLQELKKGEVIKEVKFKANSRFILLNFFGKKFLRDTALDGMCDIPLIKNDNYNYKNCIKKIYEAEYFINNIVPDFKKCNGAFMFYPTVLLNKCTDYGLDEVEFLDNLKKRFNDYLNINEIDREIAFINKREELQRKILRKEIETADFETFNDITMLDLRKRNLIIDTINFKDNRFNIDIMYFNQSSNLDAEKVVLVYSLVYKLFRRYFKWNYEVFINMNVCCCDKTSCDKLKMKLKGIKTETIINNYGVSPAFLNKVKLIDYDIPKKYFK
ncbi:hypothetical protein [Clostridium butyricum]|uniref:hypothetical protein n=1 Tax=Clostridium butyricum TaxID=1492 RepID=UPI0032C120A8